MLQDKKNPIIIVINVIPLEKKDIMEQELSHIFFWNTVLNLVELTSNSGKSQCYWNKVRIQLEYRFYT